MWRSHRRVRRAPRIARIGTGIRKAAGWLFALPGCAGGIARTFFCDAGAPLYQSEDSEDATNAGRDHLVIPTDAECPYAEPRRKRPTDARGHRCNQRQAARGAGKRRKPDDAGDC